MPQGNPVKNSDLVDGGQTIEANQLASGGPRILNTGRNAKCFQVSEPSRIMQPHPIFATLLGSPTAKGARPGGQVGRIWNIAQHRSGFDS